MYRRDLCKAGLAGIGAMVFSRPVSAVESFLKASAKKTWAVLYGSQCGSTKEYAIAINEGLGGIADVVDIAKTTPKVSDYEYFVVGGWIKGGNIQPGSIKTFVTGNKEALKSRIKGLFVVCGNGGKTTLTASNQAYLTNNLVTPSGVSDKPGKVFLGRSDPACNNMSTTYDNVKTEDGVSFGQQILTTATETIQPALPRRFELCQNSPNPFNAITTIRYSIPQTTDVVLTICALNGRRMATLFSGLQAAGTYEMTWDGSKLAPGYYLYQLEAGGFRQIRTARRIGR
ncbi:MAG: hypothetical protein JW913_14555 [Chitinispirillaceae bacterium]|nr:hypothetical protein [Chitinispirillaceae bacterium]